MHFFIDDQGLCPKTTTQNQGKWKNKKYIADRSPTASPNPPMMSGNIDPPIIPVTNIPKIEP